VIIAGLDPSLSNFGMAKGKLEDNFFALEHLHLAQTESTKNKKQVRVNSDDLNRAKLLHTATMQFLKGVDIVAIEIPVGSQSARAMASYGICVGIISSIKIPIIQVTPAEVKLAATGNKNATKKQMIDWAVGEFPNAEWFWKKQKGVYSLIDKNEHMADALAAIKAAVRTDTFKQLIAIQEAFNANA
jgi:Holliday junction resolvasome RuvABC endonuclease subunit